MTDVPKNLIRVTGYEKLPLCFADGANARFAFFFGNTETFTVVIIVVLA